MHLQEIVALRPKSAAGVYLALTRRCPLACEHCSTNSLMASEEHDAELFLRFVQSFSPMDHPDLVYLTGGEALLRPELVREITQHVHRVGGRVALVSGLYFARQATIPAPVQRAIDGVDHFCTSLDVFHERQVARADVFRVLHQLLDQGKSLSIQLTGIDDNDPYLAETTAAIRQSFGDRVPVMVARLGAVGRARDWYKPDATVANLPVSLDPLASLGPDPCDMATWPTVTFDGTVVACCNQDIVDGPAPPHLRLGHTAVDDWATIKQRCLNNTVLRGLRVYGPAYAAAKFGSGVVSCDGYCSTCQHLSDDPSIEANLTPVMASPGMRVVEEHVAGLQSQYLVRRHGVGRYADLVHLGEPETQTAGSMAVAE